MKKESHQKNVKIHMRVIALFLCALIFSSCTNCASCNFADLFNIEIIPDASEKESASGIEGSSDEEKHTHTHSEMPTEKQTGLPTEEPTEPVPEWNEDIKHEIQLEYWDQFVERGKYDWELYPDVQFFGMFDEAYAVYVLDQIESSAPCIYYINGYEFRFRGRRTIHLYKDGEFYSLQEALDKEMIDDDDFYEIYSEYRTLNADKYKKIYDGYRGDTIWLDRIKVTLQPSYNTKDYTIEDFADIGALSLRDNGIGPEESNEIMRRYTIYVPETTQENLIKLIKILEAREDIYEARPSSTHTIKLDEVPNDVYYGATSQWGLSKIEAPDAWDIETGNNTVLVGVIDSGIDGTHPDLQQRVDTTLSKSFSSAYSSNTALQDAHGHGTMVASIIGGQGNNSIGISGVCWDVRLVSLRAVDSYGDFDIDAVIAAIEYADRNNIKILNLSGSTSENNSDLQAAIEDYDGLIICTPGNSLPQYTVSIDIAKVYPASYPSPKIIVVGNSDTNDNIHETSNYGAVSVDLFAPGTGILGCYPTNLCNNNCTATSGHVYSGYHTKTGTSFAAPFVTGVAALVLAQHPNYSASQIKGIILNNVDLVPGLQSLCTTGGRLNAYNAVSYTHSYTHEYVSNGLSSHRAYCECEEYITQAHSYTYSYSSLNENQHKASCRCGAYITVNHSYTNRYVSANASMHKAYCICDAYKFENHSMSNPNSSGLATCSKCGHGIQMWNITPKYELE